MTLDTFRKLAEHRFEVCLDLMCGKKNEEYSRNNDKLHNFKKAALIEDLTPEMALLGMMTKHLVSIIDICQDSNVYQELPDKALLAEKITDTVNYLVLLEAIIEEQR